MDPNKMPSFQNEETKRKNPKILVVDDEPDWCELITLELGSRGYKIVTARHATEGLLYLRRGAFDLLITDVQMPGDMDGIDLVEIYRKEDPALKVIFITGHALEEKLASALRDPKNLCLKKPFDIEELARSVDSLLASA